MNSAFYKNRYTKTVLVIGPPDLLSQSGTQYFKTF